MSNLEPAQGAARPSDECPVCSEVSLARQRHWFWVFAEKLGDGAFLTRLGTGGGYCVRHARELLLHEQGERTARGFQFVLRGWRAGLGGSMRLDCPACRIEAETEAYVLRLLSRGLWSGDQQTRLDPDALSCLPHARMLLEQAPDGILPEALKRLGATVDRVRAGDGGSQAEIHTAIGHGYDETFRRPERCDTGATAVLSFDAADRGRRTSSDGSGIRIEPTETRMTSPGCVLPICGMPRRTIRKLRSGRCSGSAARGSGASGDSRILSKAPRRPIGRVDRAVAGGAGSVDGSNERSRDAAVKSSSAEFSSRRNVWRASQP